MTKRIGKRQLRSIFSFLRLGNSLSLSSSVRKRLMLSAIAIETLHDQRHTEARKCDVLAAAIRWALGEGDSDFGDHTAHGAPRYWWRKELRMRAFGKELLLTDEGDEVKVRCPTCGGSNTFDWAYWILWVAFGFLLVSK